MTIQHTPGPWKVEAEDGQHLYHKHRYITAGEDDTDAWEIVARVSDAQNQEANSRLIAAAPELLDVVKMALLNCCIDNHAGADDFTCVFCNAARAVIAKATGETK